jgi:hypothetical protein
MDNKASEKDNNTSLMPLMFFLVFIFSIIPGFFCFLPIPVGFVLIVNTQMSTEKKINKGQLTLIQERMLKDRTNTILLAGTGISLILCTFWTIFIIKILLPIFPHSLSTYIIPQYTPEINYSFDPRNLAEFLKLPLVVILAYGAGSIGVLSIFLVLINLRTYQSIGLTRIDDEYLDAPANITDAREQIIWKIIKIFLYLSFLGLIFLHSFLFDFKSLSFSQKLFFNVCCSILLTMYTVFMSKCQLYLLKYQKVLLEKQETSSLVRRFFRDFRTWSTGQLIILLVSYAFGDPKLISQNKVLFCILTILWAPQITFFTLVLKVFTRQRSNK